MIELSLENAVGYLRGRGAVSSGEVLVRALSGGVANVVLQVFDVDVGVGGNCFVLKQPLGRFRTAAEWLVDIERMVVERDCMELLGGLLPAGSVPEVLWFDAENYVLAMTCAPADAVIWKKELLAGNASVEAAAEAGVVLGMMHSGTKGDAAVEKRYGDPKFFIQQRIDPYLRAAGEKHEGLRGVLEGVSEQLLEGRQCLIHGDYSPKNIFLVPEGEKGKELLAGKRGETKLSHLMVLDFEVAFYGHCAFDVATLINHFLLKGFYHGAGWRKFMVMVERFWETYQGTAEGDLVESAREIGGHVLGALLLARVDGKSPVEYLVGMREKQEQVRGAAVEILSQQDASLEHAIDLVSGWLDKLP